MKSPTLTPEQKEALRPVLRHYQREEYSGRLRSDGAYPPERLNLTREQARALILVFECDV